MKTDQDQILWYFKELYQIILINSKKQSLEN